MKKILLALVLVASMGFFVACAPSNDEEASRKAFTGSWSLASMDDGTNLRESEEMDRLKALGLTVSLSLDSDGSAVLWLLGEEDRGSWSPVDASKATITLADREAVEMTIADDVLTLTQDNYILKFTKGENGNTDGGSAGGETRTVALEPVTVADDNIVSIEIVEKRSDLVGDRGFTAVVQNRSDEPIRVQVEEDSSSVDGKMADLSGGQVIQPGKYAEVFFWFNKDSLGSGGLDAIHDVEGTLVVTNQDGSRVLGSYSFAF